MDGKVVLITGAAGTGKSTLVRLLVEQARPFKRVDYGQLLLERKAQEAGVQMTYDELRRDSGTVITPMARGEQYHHRFSFGHKRVLRVSHHSVLA